VKPAVVRVIDKSETVGAVIEGKSAIGPTAVVEVAIDDDPPLLIAVTETLMNLSTSLSVITYVRSVSPEIDE
jgi:hypothetical protein